MKWFAEDSGHFGDTKEFATLGSMVTGHQLKISLVSWTMAAQEEGQLEPFCGRSATQRLAEDVAGKLGNVLAGTDAKPRADPAPPSADAAPEKVAQWLYGVIQDPVGDQSLKEANSSLAQQLKVHILDSLEAGQTVTRVIEILVEAHGANIVSSPCAGGNLFPQSVRDRCRLLSE